MTTDNDEIAKAIDLARTVTGAGPTPPATSEPVSRLDHPGESYLLVFLGALGEAGWVAAVRLGPKMEVMNWAANPSGERTALPGVLDSELVWEPGGTSRSPIFPERRAQGPVTEGETGRRDRTDG